MGTQNARVQFGATALAVLLLCGLVWRFWSMIDPLSARRASAGGDAAGPFLTSPGFRPPAEVRPESSPGITRTAFDEPAPPSAWEMEVEAYDTEGRPIADALVGLRAEHVSVATTTDAEGKGFLTADRSAVVTAHAAATGYFPESAVTTLVLGKRGAIRIVLAKAAKLTVNVKGPTGSPLSNVVVRLRAPEDADEALGLENENRRTNEQGQVVFMLRPGYVGRLQADSEVHVPHVVPIGPVAAAGETIDLALVEGESILLRLAERNGEALPPRTTVYLRFDGGPRVLFTFAPWSGYVRRPPGAVVSLEPVHAEDFVVHESFRAAEFDAGKGRPPKVAPGRPSTNRTILDAKISIAATARVLLKDRSGLRVFSAFLERDPPDGPSRPVATNEDGYVLVPRTGLPSSRAFRFRDAEGRTTPWNDGTIRRGESPLDCVLDP